VDFTRSFLSTIYMYTLFVELNVYHVIYTSRQNKFVLINYLGIIRLYKGWSLASGVGWMFTCIRLTV